jgi:hypothetical protein
MTAAAAAAAAAAIVKFFRIARMYRESRRIWRLPLRLRFAVIVYMLPPGL